MPEDVLDQNGQDGPISNDRAAPSLRELAAPSSNERVALSVTEHTTPVLSGQASPALEGIASAAEIPDKLFFRIGDVAKLAGIKPYVLRFWETEFPGLGPKKSGTGHRLYRRKDVEMVLEIKRLLYEQRFTIEGARKFLESRPKTDVGSSSNKPAKRRTAKSAAPARKGQADLFGTDSSELLDTIRKELREIVRLLK
jgi:DNA-binding transcriptional MerR regulator